MSVAFTRESDLEATAAELPDRPISTHPNLVTPEGLAMLDAALEEARKAYAAALADADLHEDRTAIARAARDLRYYTARRATAQVQAPPADTDVVAFGSTVVIDREDGRRQTYRIVGEDEANPPKGLVSYVSPLAQALLGKRVGDEAVVAGGEVEIVEIG